MSFLLMIPILIPAIVGIILLLSYLNNYLKNREISTTKNNSLSVIVGIVLFVSVGSAISVVWSGDRNIVLFKLVEDIPIYFNIDELSRVFVTFTSVIWLCVGIYAFSYMKHEGKEKKFFGFYLLTYSILIALDLAGNLVTLYLCYELMTLLSAPLVLHSGSRKSIMAALKYIFFSMTGAYCALYGIYFINKYCYSLAFTKGGTLNYEIAMQNRTVLLIAIFVMIIGFCTKAGMLPLHAWLPTAHPVAPTPASSVLSAIIVKAGVLAIIRSIYYIVGIEFIKGTWVQYVWIFLTILTIFMGSMLAYLEKNMKKRLAYSTVSQVSYILFGLALFNKIAFIGAMLHIIFHAIIKTGLFLTAGMFILNSEKTEVSYYKGIGKKMPITLWCYTIFSLALVGIPLFSGFISKWYLGIGAIKSEIGTIGIVGVGILLISALLTAGYLLPITIDGFMPGKDFVIDKTEDTGVTIKKEKDKKMLLVLIVLAIMTVVLGVFPNICISYIQEIANIIM